MEELVEFLETFVLVRGTVWSAEFAHFVEDVPFLGYLMPGRKALQSLVQLVWAFEIQICDESEGTILFSSPKLWKAFPDGVLSCPCLYATFLIFFSLLLSHTCSQRVGLGDVPWMTELLENDQKVQNNWWENAAGETRNQTLGSFSCSQAW